MAFRGIKHFGSCCHWKIQNFRVATVTVIHDIFRNAVSLHHRENSRDVKMKVTTVGVHVCITFPETPHVFRNICTNMSNYMPTQFVNCS